MATTASISAVRTRFILTGAAAGIGFDTVAYNGTTFTVTYMPGADQSAGSAFIAAFDQSAAAQATWESNRAAAKALSTNAVFLALSSPTTAQSLAQIQALTRQNTVIINLLLQQFG